MTNSKLYLTPRKCPDARILHHFVISFLGGPRTPRLKGCSLHFPPIFKKNPSIQNLNETTGSLFVFLSFFFLSLYCLSSSFCHCIVCPLLFVIVLSVLFFWSLYCLSSSFGHCIVCLFSFGHCIVCPFLLVIVLSVLLLLVIVLSVLFFWSLYCLSFSFGHCIVCPSLKHYIWLLFFLSSIFSCIVVT